MAYRSAPRLDKPVPDERLIEVMVAAFSAQARGPATHRRTWYCRQGMPVESDLYAPVKALLEGQGYVVKGEVRGCDVVAVRGEEPPVIVELKRVFGLGAGAAGRRPAGAQRPRLSRASASGPSR